MLGLSSCAVERSSLMFCSLLFEKTNEGVLHSFLSSFFRSFAVGGGHHQVVPGFYFDTYGVAWRRQ
jgi:hypothetical protein